MTSTTTSSDTIGIRAARYVTIPSKRIPSLTEPTRRAVPRSGPQPRK